MIKVGIIGADKPDSGELLRILVNHPEVDVVSLFAPGMTGRQVTSCHAGFIGERAMTFSDKIDPSKLDVVFIADDSQVGKDVKERVAEWPELRVIDLSPSRFDGSLSSEFAYGLSEINRKGLVRGAKYAAVPSPMAALALIALYPLASHLLLSADLEVVVSAPDDIVKSVDTNIITDEILWQLRNAQSSFDGNVTIKLLPADSHRVMRIHTILKCPLALDEVEKIYDSIFDDHNFTFTSFSNVGGEEVEVTQKSVVSFNKPGAGLLEIVCVADCRLRGGAGDAVHAMNLLFSLHEKVGLQLKSAAYGSCGETVSKVASWFA